MLDCSVTAGQWEEQRYDGSMRQSCDILQWGMRQKNVPVFSLRLFAVCLISRTPFFDSLFSLVGASILRGYIKCCLVIGLKWPKMEDTLSLCVQYNAVSVECECPHDNR